MSNVNYQLFSDLGDLTQWTINNHIQPPKALKDSEADTIVTHSSDAKAEQQALPILHPSLVSSTTPPSDIQSIQSYITNLYDIYTENNIFRPWVKIAEEINAKFNLQLLSSDCKKIANMRHQSKTSKKNSIYKSKRLFPFTKHKASSIPLTQSTPQPNLENNQPSLPLPSSYLNGDNLNASSSINAQSEPNTIDMTAFQSFLVNCMQYQQSILPVQSTIERTPTWTEEQSLALFNCVQQLQNRGKKSRKEMPIWETASLIINELYQTSFSGNECLAEYVRLLQAKVAREQIENKAPSRKHK